MQKIENSMAATDVGDWAEQIFVPAMDASVRPPPIGGGGAREARDGGVDAGFAGSGVSPSVSRFAPDSSYRGSTGVPKFEPLGRVSSA